MNRIASPPRDRSGPPLQRARLSGLSGLSLGLGLACGPAFAQSGDTAGRPSLAPVQIEASRHTPLALDEPTQTGSRLGLTPLETPASIEVLTGDAIRARGDVSVVEAASRRCPARASP